MNAFRSPNYRKNTYRYFKVELLIHSVLLYERNGCYLFTSKEMQTNRNEPKNKTMEKIAGLTYAPVKNNCFSA